ncbi:MAG: SCO family protein [Rhizobacter sp.]|nr:SCO family protein [Chlorobiales bacterium]
MQNKYLFRTLMWGSLAVVILAGLTIFTIEKANSSRAAIPVISRLPEFSFTERSGKPFGLADLKGKLTVADFIFTDCPGACPVMSEKMSELYKLYTSDAERGDKVQFVSITVDPETDSLEVLQEYAKRYNAGNQWFFLRGELAEVIKLSEQGFKIPAADLPSGHSTKFILIDEDAQVRGYYSPNTKEGLALLKTHLRELALEEKK